MGKEKYSNQRKPKKNKRPLRDKSSYEERYLDHSDKRKGKRINPHEWDSYEDEGWHT